MTHLITAITLAVSIAAGGALRTGSQPATAATAPYFGYSAERLAFSKLADNHPVESSSDEPPAETEYIIPSHGDRINPETGQLEVVPLDNPTADNPTAEEERSAKQLPIRGNNVRKTLALGGLALIVAAALFAARRLQKKTPKS